MTWLSLAQYAYVAGLLDPSQTKSLSALWETKDGWKKFAKHLARRSPVSLAYLKKMKPSETASLIAGYTNQPNVILRWTQLRMMAGSTTLAEFVTQVTAPNVTVAHNIWQTYKDDVAALYEKVRTWPGNKQPELQREKASRSSFGLNSRRSVSSQRLQSFRTSLDGAIRQD